MANARAVLETVGGNVQSVEKYLILSVSCKVYDECVREWWSWGLGQRTGGNGGGISQWLDVHNPHL